MLKKLLALFIILSLNAPYASARVGTPSFNFEIAENPAAQDTGSKDNGLSGGAITAITLGSIGGAGLLGLGAFLLRRQAEKNLAAGTVIGTRKPICPICLDKNPNAQIYERINKNYPYLKKALSLNEIHYCPDSKYILVYDTSIEKRKFDLIKFYIPQNTKSLKITHVTDPFEEGDISTELYMYKKNQSNPSESAMLKGESNKQNGIIIKTTSSDISQYESASYIISNYASKKTYAVVIELIAE